MACFSWNDNPALLARQKCQGLVFSVCLSWHGIPVLQAIWARQSGSQYFWSAVLKIELLSYEWVWMGEENIWSLGYIASNLSSASWSRKGTNVGGLTFLIAPNQELMGERALFSWPHPIRMELLSCLPGQLVGRERVISKVPYTLAILTGRIYFLNKYFLICYLLLVLFPETLKNF